MLQRNEAMLCDNKKMHYIEPKAVLHTSNGIVLCYVTTTMR